MMAAGHGSGGRGSDCTAEEKGTCWRTITCEGERKRRKQVYKLIRPGVHLCILKKRRRKSIGIFYLQDAAKWGLRIYIYVVYGK